MLKGDTLESRFSKNFHKNGVPFLVSPLLLRSQNLGQIDVALLEKNSSKLWFVRIVELKSCQALSKRQYLRLKKTQDYLSRVLDIEVKLEVNFCQKDDDSLFF